jgi:hypothetical protein
LPCPALGGGQSSRPSTQPVRQADLSPLCCCCMWISSILCCCCVIAVGDRLSGPCLHVVSPQRRYSQTCPYACASHNPRPDGWSWSACVASWGGSAQSSKWKTRLRNSIDVNGIHLHLGRAADSATVAYYHRSMKLCSSLVLTCCLCSQAE